MEPRLRPEVAHGVTHRNGGQVLADRARPVAVLRQGREHAGLELGQAGRPVVHLLRVVDRQPAVIDVMRLADGLAEQLPQARWGIRGNVTCGRREYQRPEVGPVPGLVQSDAPGHAVAPRRRTGGPPAKLWGVATL